MVVSLETVFASGKISSKRIAKAQKEIVESYNEEKRFGESTGYIKREQINRKCGEPWSHKNCLYANLRVVF